MKDLSYKITVPEPCTEDFSKMTPKDNGAFCNSCEKTVVDFSKMNDAQVSEYISAHPEQKICGKFINTQLGRPIGNTVPTLTAFLASLLLVFGAALFEFTYTPGSYDAMFKSPGTGVTDDANRVEMVGMMSFIPPTEDTTDLEVQDSLVEYDKQELPVLDVMDTLGIRELNSLDFTVIDQVYTLGGCSYILQRYEEPTVIVPVTPTDSFYLAKEEKPSLPNDVIASPTLESYPNPSNGIINIRYMLPAESDVTIEIYDLNGNKMMDLVSSNSLYEGTYIYPADLSELANGMYICRMIAGEKTFTTRIVLNK